MPRLLNGLCFHGPMQPTIWTKFFRGVWKFNCEHTYLGLLDRKNIAVFATAQKQSE